MTTLAIILMLSAHYLVVDRLMNLIGGMFE